MSVAHRLSQAGAMGLLALVAVATPASAAEPTVTWTRPSVEEDVLTEPGPITGTITADGDETIENVRFELVPEAPTNGPDDACQVNVPTSTQVLDGSSSEDFEIVDGDGNLDFPCNGRYRLTATVGYETTRVDVPPLTVPFKDTVTSTLNFSVAIPPGQVQGLSADYDGESKQVRLAWAANGEVDLLGYVVERNPPGPEGFVPIGPDLIPPGETAFTDTGIEDEFRYQVLAVRRGADEGGQIRSEPSPLVTAGPERTTPTLPDDLPAANSRPRSATGGRPRATPAPAAPGGRTSSNIFEETLPFDPSQTVPSATDTEADGQASVVAEFDDGAPEDRRRATLIPIAGGLALVMGAMHLFLLSKRAGEAELPVSRS